MDRTFVRGVHEARQDANVVRFTIALAHNLGLQLAAEDVATLALLHDRGRAGAAWRVEFSLH